MKYSIPGSRDPGIPGLSNQLIPNPGIGEYYPGLQTLIPTIPEIEKLKLDDFIKYFKRFWLTQVKPSELSIFELENGTNNGAESYHSHLKSLFKSSHPQIWKFMDTLNNAIADYDNEISRLEQGRNITRSRKKHVRDNMQYRNVCKEKLLTGIIVHGNFWILLADH